MQNQSLLPSLSSSKHDTLYSFEEKEHGLMPTNPAQRGPSPSASLTPSQQKEPFIADELEGRSTGQIFSELASTFSVPIEAPSTFTDTSPIENDPAEFPEELSWDDGWTIIDDFFPEPDCTDNIRDEGWKIINDFFPEPDFTDKNTKLLSEDMEINEIQDKHDRSKTVSPDTQLVESSVVGFLPGTFESYLVENPSGETDEKHGSEAPASIEDIIRPSYEENSSNLEGTNTFAPLTQALETLTPASLPTINEQSVPRTWPLQRALPLRSSLPTTPYAAFDSPALPSSSVLAPSSGIIDPAQAGGAPPAGLSASSPSPFVEDHSQVAATPNGPDSTVAVHEEVQTKAKKGRRTTSKIPPKPTRRRNRASQVPANDDGGQKPADSNSPSKVPTEQTAQDSRQSAPSVNDISLIAQLENAAKNVNENTEPQEPPAKKARTPCQRKKQGNIPISSTEKSTTAVSTETPNKTALEHPDEEASSAKKRGRKPTQPRKKKAVPKKGMTDGPKGGERAADIKLPEATGLEVEDPGNMEAKFMIPEPTTPAIDKPEVY